MEQKSSLQQDKQNKPSRIEVKNLDTIIEESSSREKQMSLDNQMMRTDSNIDMSIWMNNDSSVMRSELRKTESFDQNNTLLVPSPGRSKKVDRNQPLDIIDESQEEQLLNQGKRSQHDSGEYVSGGKNAQQSQQSKESSSGSNNKAGKQYSSFNSNYKLVEVEQNAQPKKVNSFTPGSTFSQNYQIESACQPINKIGGNQGSSFQKSSSFGQGYSFGQQQAVAQKQANLDVPKPKETQIQKSSSFNKNYSIANSQIKEVSESVSLSQEPPKSQGGSFASYKFSSAQIDTPNLKDDKIKSIPLEQELISSTNEGQQLNTHRGNTVNDNTSQFTYNTNRNDNSEGGPKKFKRKNQLSTFRTGANDNSINGSSKLRSKRNRMRRDSCLDGLDLNIVKGFQKPVSYGIGSALDIGQTADLSATINPGHFDQKGYIPPPQAENNLLSSTFKGFDDLGDMSQMNPAKQQNDILNQSYSNLLMFGSGKELQQNNVRQRLNSVMVGVQDHAAIIRDIQKLKNQPPPVIPKFKGYGDSGQTRFQTSQPTEAPAPTEQSALPVHPVQGSAGAPVPFSEQMTLDEKKQLQAQMKIQMRVNKSEMYLKKLRSCKSYEKPQVSIEQKIRKKAVFFDNIKVLDLQESISSDITSEKEQKPFKQIKGEFRIRLKSEHQITFSGLVYYRSLKCSFKLERLISVNEVIELRHIIQKMMIGVPKINYYFVILQDTKNLIDFFVDQPLESFMTIKPLKEIIYKFEQLKSDLLRKIKNAAQQRDHSGEDKSLYNKSQEVPIGNLTVGTGESTKETQSPRLDDISVNRSYISQSYSLSQLEIGNLKHIFNEIRYILTKFGRSINYIDKIQAGYKRYLLKIEMNKAPQNKPSDTHGSPSNKLAPPIKRIIEQQKRDFLNNTNPLPINKVCKKEEKPKQSYKTFVAEEKKMNKSRVVCLNFNKEKNNNQVFHIIEIMTILSEFPLEERLRIIFNYHKLICKKWKEEFDNNRVKNMPSILCRICNREFYADQSEIHSKNCIDKNMKIKAQKDLNTEFILLSNRATEVMIQIERINIQTPEFKSQSKFGKVLQTPSLQRRALGGITMNHFDKTSAVGSTPKSIPLPNRAFSISGGSGLNKFSSDLLKLPQQQKVSEEQKLNPLLAYSLNHQVNQSTQETQKVIPNNPFESASKSPNDQTKKIPLLNFAKLNTFVKDETIRQKLSSNQLEIISEEMPKKQQIISQEMIDIAEIRFNNRSERIKNELQEEYKNFEVKNQHQYDRRENLIKLKNQIISLMVDKEKFDSGMKIELKNHARQVSQKSLMRKEAQSKSLVKTKVNDQQKISNKMQDKIKIKYYVTEEKRIDINKFISKNPLLISRFIKNPQSKSKDLHMPSITKIDSNTSRLPSQSRLSADRQKESNKYAQKRELSDSHSNNISHSLKLSQKLLDKQIRNELKTVKQEITIMENLKDLTQSCFDMSQINHSFRSQISIYKQYQNQIIILQQKKEFIQLPELIYQFLISLEDVINRKLTAIYELAEIEQEYNKTLSKQEFEKLCKSLKQLDCIFDKLQGQANNMQLLLSNLACYQQNTNSNDGSSSNNTRIRLDNKSIYERRQSVAAPMLGSFVPQNKMMSMHSRILDTTDNSQIYRRGSTVYSQFSLLSELDSEKAALSKIGGKIIRQNSSNHSGDNKYYDRMRQDSIQVSNYGSALQEIQEKINQENNDMDNNSVQSPKDNVIDLVALQTKKTPEQSLNKIPFGALDRPLALNKSDSDVNKSFHESFAQLIVDVNKREEIILDNENHSQKSAPLSPLSLLNKKKAIRQNSKQYEKSKFQQFQTKDEKLEDEQSDANSSSNSATNKNVKPQEETKNQTKKYFPTLEEIEEFVPLSKILTYVDNLKLQQGIKTSQNGTKSSKESLMVEVGKLKNSSSEEYRDTLENLSLPSDSSGDFQGLEDEFNNEPQNGLKIPHFAKQNTQSMDKITYKSTGNGKIHVPVSLFHFQNSPATKLINITKTSGQIQSDKGKNNSQPGEMQKIYPQFSKMENFTKYCLSQEEVKSQESTTLKIKKLNTDKKGVRYNK